ncbi:hypothetical protein ACFP7A_00935 [Sporolactobacillus kofuensis]|uniref:Uncharacterized protein n=1 Tax=Sporolactobacillus kofuensis TaxID=269672 RepID=A0ABW1WC40_9BACL|nr:hypothetical protein [Sporolactobacillus kofuensis]MCO7175532.1 hypothetical protein [Sporolactobacillus kofuensis]
MTPEAKEKLEAHIIDLKQSINAPDQIKRITSMASVNELIKIRRIMNDPDFDDVMQQHLQDFAKGVLFNLMLINEGISIKPIK